MPAEFDEGGSIGKRYRRQDEIGTPWGVTIDGETMEDDTVTLRDRDSLEQVRVPASGLADELLRAAAPGLALAQDRVLRPGLIGPQAAPHAPQWAVPTRLRLSQFEQLAKTERPHPSQRSLSATGNAQNGHSRLRTRRIGTRRAR